MGLLIGDERAAAVDGVLDRLAVVGDLGDQRPRSTLGGPISS
jgi:hypothetical protein